MRLTDLYASARLPVRLAIRRAANPTPIGQPRIMRLTHVNITIPKDGEDLARSFYVDLLRLREIPKPEAIRHRDGVWFDAGGIDLHLSVEEPRPPADTYRHFGLECDDVADLRTRLNAAGIATDDGRPAPWQRFFVYDPFGNRIEIHESGAMRA